MIWEQSDPSSAEIQAFAKVLGCNWIGTVPVKAVPFATELCCHENVVTQVAMGAGRHVRGYTFMTFGHRTQAIYHSVWEDPVGELIDVTPFLDGRTSCVFASLPPEFEGLVHKSIFDQDFALGRYDQGEFYVYFLCDPRDGKPFYVGKGTGKRARTHLWANSREQNQYKTNKIKALRSEGVEPDVVIAAEGIRDEQFAYDLERAAIRMFGRKGYDPGGILTNVCEDSRPPSHRDLSYEEIYGPLSI